MNVPRWILSLAIPLLGFAAPLAAEAPNSGTVPIVFPDIEGFTRSEPQHLPDPKYGYVISYSSDQPLTIHVYVYNSGFVRIPDGAASNVVKEEIALIEEGLKKLKNQGMYRSYKERARGEGRIGDWPRAPTAQRRLIEIDRADVGLILTEVYITGYKNHFVKIRLSYAIDKGIELEKTIASVLTALGKMMAS